MSKILVQVRPNSRQESVERSEDGVFIIRVNAPPRDGKANQRVVELLSQHLGVPKSKIELVSGGKSKLKTFKVPERD